MVAKCRAGWAANNRSGARHEAHLTKRHRTGEHTASGSRAFNLALSTLYGSARPDARSALSITSLIALGT